MDKNSAPQEVVDAVIGFLNAADEETKRSLVELRWKELNTDDADSVVAHILEKYGDDKQSVTYLRQLRFLLHRCRNEGIKRAFETPPPYFDESVEDAVREFVNANTSNTTREVFHNYTEALLSAEADRVLEFMLLFFRDDSQLCKRLQERRLQLQKCAQGEMAAAFPQDRLEISEDIVKAISEFVDAPDWPRKRRVLRALQKELLSEEADAFLEFITDRNLEDPMTAKLIQHRSVLERCRKDGLEVVIGTTSETAPVSSHPDESALHDLEKELNSISGGIEIVSEVDIKALLERRPDLREAWEFYREHTMVISDEDSGKQNLAEIMQQFMEAFRTHDFARQIDLLRTGLSLPLIEQLPDLWASFHHHLGSALSQCPSQNRDQLIEESLEHHRLALTVFKAETRPIERADNLRDMGNAYCQRTKGDRSENLELAINCYEECADLYARVKGVAPPDTYLNLGNAYTIRVKGSHRDNVERAIEHLALACDHFHPSSAEWASANLNLGNALVRRTNGDRADNIERAISCYEEAYSIHSALGLHDGMGLHHLSMSNAYIERIVGDPKSNREKAISHAREAIRMFPRERWPEKWAEAQNKLGVLFLRKGSKEGNLTIAIESFERALEVYVRSRYPTDWAKVQLNLGVTWQALTGQENSKEKAITYFSNALEIYTRQTFPQRWSSTHQNLGLLYARMSTSFEDAYSSAEEHLRLALEERPADLLPSLAFETLAVLGRLHFKHFQWSRANSSLQEALNAAEGIFTYSYTEEGRHHELRNIAGLYPIDAYCLLRLGQKQEAFNRIEEGKARLLAQALALSDLEADMLPEADYVELSSARDAVKQAETGFKMSSSQAEVSEEASANLRNARHHLSQVISGIRRRIPEFLPSGLPAAKLTELCPKGGAIVAPFITDQGGGVFVLPDGTVDITDAHLVEIDELNTRSLNSLIYGQRDSENAVSWLNGYASLLFERGVENWLASVLEITGTLWDLLMSKVSSRLEELDINKASPVVLMPQGGLGILPLHAAWRGDKTSPHYFSDDYIVSYMPSGYAWSVIRRRSKRRNYNDDISLLAVVNPTLDLPFSSEEGDEVSAAFRSYECVRLDGEHASPKAVLNASPKVTHVHFACHGSYDWSEPMASSLALADGQALRLKDIVRNMDLHSCRLVVLSACETGISEFQEMPDEFLGLSSGFLQAGAAAVISTLWPVNDFSTMLLMKHLYEKHLGEGLSPSVALHQAQHWLRNVSNAELADLFHNLRDSASDSPRMTYEVASSLFKEFALASDPESRPFAHPHHWAAFTVTGE